MLLKVILVNPGLFRCMHGMVFHVHWLRLFHFFAVWSKLITQNRHWWSWGTGHRVSYIWWSTGQMVSLSKLWSSNNQSIMMFFNPSCLLKGSKTMARTFKFSCQEKPHVFPVVQSLKNQMSHYQKILCSFMRTSGGRRRGDKCTHQNKKRQVLSCSCRFFMMFFSWYHLLLLEETRATTSALHWLSSVVSFIYYCYLLNPFFQTRKNGTITGLLDLNYSWLNHVC